MSTVVYFVQTSQGSAYYSSLVEDVIGAIGAVLNIAPDKAKALWNERFNHRAKSHSFSEGKRSVTITRLVLRSVTQHSVKRAMGL